MYKNKKNLLCTFRTWLEVTTDTKSIETKLVEAEQDRIATHTTTQNLQLQHTLQANQRMKDAVTRRP